ncbi:uncharacterized protein LOC112515405 [Cynara cardunculus var. scolymus]|uniref:Uncharacterized protein n=1 Tax=Cynara cardunculus var. scolymus TaxID=59895 RepID=A0A103XKT5_CYNCS|nr:uncharacterized protein LOC112515405 [Cynara cardunculus var. scolymus]KVH92581.1 hypothetical protein Ccrd_005402 [Cynara cardunculus var. scolymus]
MSGREDSDSDAPEEFTVEQAIQKDEEIRTIQKENKARVLRERKERRRTWAQKLTPRVNKSIQDATEEIETQPENKGMLPDDIVKLLAANEKKVFSSDSDEEKSEKRPRKKKSKHSGMGPVILKEIPPPPCLQNSLDFLKKRKMAVPRSSAILDNSNQALRLLSASGMFGKK